MTFATQDAGTIGRLDACPVCYLALPLRLPELGEEGHECECAGCGSRFYAVVSEDAPADLRQHVRLLNPSAANDRRLQSTRRRIGFPLPFEPAAIASLAEVPPNRRGMRTSFQTAISRFFDTQINSGRNLVLPPQGTPFASRIQRRGTDHFDGAKVDGFLAGAKLSRSRLSNFFDCLEKKQDASAEVLHVISRDALVSAADDIDLFVALGIKARPDEYPSCHSLHSGSLAMAIGATLGYDSNTLIELGIGCLVHDVGMLSLHRNAYDSNRVLSADEFSEVAKHPVFTFELLNQHMSWIPAASRMVAYQIHERCDGSGYPRGRSTRQIHELARVAAVADVFVAMLSPRPHRPAMLPYRAMEKIVYDTKKGCYDPEVVRALLRTVSLFPLGSWVELNDGRIAQVIRARGEQWDRPVLDVYCQPRQESESVTIDLSLSPRLRIVRAVPARVS